MGNPMAKNLLKNAFPLSVYNRSETKTKEFAQLGAKVFKSPASLAKEVDVIITMVTGPKDVEEVYLGEEGVLQANKKNLIAIDMSTIGPQAAKKIGEALQASDIAFLDAPVTGSVPKAITGELTIFIGGNKKTYEKIKPVLSAMGTNLQYMGEVGTGQAIKLINNYLIATSLTALAESMFLADAQGLSRKKAAETLSSVPALSAFMKMKLPHVVTNTHPVAFSLANMRKDLGLATSEMKKRNNDRLPLLQLVENLFDKGVSLQLGQQDVSAIQEVLTQFLHK